MASQFRAMMATFISALLLLLILPGPVAAQETSPGGKTFSNDAWDCSGWHTVKSGETCKSVEKKYNITNTDFLHWNPSVSKDCKTNWKAEYSYCVRVGAPTETVKGIAANCNKWHVVAKGDDCPSVEKKYKITSAEFLKWNPAVDKKCTKNFWVKYSYCVGIDKDAHPTSTSTTKSTSKTSSKTSTKTSSTKTVPTSTPPYSTRNPVTSYSNTPGKTATAFPPEHTKPGQPPNCNRWHWVSIGDSCQSIVNLYSTRLTAEQFHEYNPSVGDDCSGLFVGWYVCVGTQSKTSSSIGWSTSATNASIPAPTEFNPPPATFVQNFTAEPHQSGIPDSCGNFYLAQNGDTCKTVLGIYNYINKDQFFDWNPALKGNCDSLQSGMYYCVANFEAGKAPMPATLTSGASPTASGTTSECKAWYQAVGSDNCATISITFGTFSEDDFITWNPSVSPDCSTIVENTFYCVAVPGTPTTRTATVPPTPTGSRPTQSGINPKCTRYWLVSPSDSCDSIQRATHLSSEDFHAWNPALGDDCKGLEVNYYVCVSTKPVVKPTSTVTVPGDGNGGGGGSTKTTKTTTKTGTETTKPPATTTTGEPVSTPTPHMPDMVEGCVRFFYRGKDAADMFCQDLADAAGISVEDFYAWNGDMGKDCTGLWANNWYCIGISGPHTTISSGTPKPPASTTAASTKSGSASTTKSASKSSSKSSSKSASKSATKSA
ncbi:uncharacterized protein C8A04DRAFT_29180 [Dichotomopilus funicola]|uniref:LysM domain-containing protein n=1 Tax=Dichotomopilus funicola TaxID=1934379 RepID=A0AAN6V1K0_9PEZI|nr:hypothetical protein C8A04DRAFT_29180 [Dichotomopilus funicola]